MPLYRPTLMACRGAILPYDLKENGTVCFQLLARMMMGKDTEFFLENVKRRNRFEFPGVDDRKLKDMRVC